jgi:hypothetical protein
MAKKKSSLAKEDPFGNFSPSAKSANEQALDAFFGPESDEEDALTPQERMLRQERARIAACAKPMPVAQISGSGNNRGSSNSSSSSSSSSSNGSSSEDEVEIEVRRRKKEATTTKKKKKTKKKRKAKMNSKTSGAVPAVETTCSRDL